MKRILAVAKGRLCIALLAAGSSQRFGSADKLAQDLGGLMLGLHMAQRLADFNAEKIVIASRDDHPCSDRWKAMGYNLIVNTDTTSGMGSSVVLAAKHALEIEADKLLICLADMPFVPVPHIHQLIAKLESAEGDIGASSDGEKSMPPAIFGSAYFDQITKLGGDKGARGLIADAPSILLTRAQLMDVDTPDDLEAARLMLPKLL